MQKKITTKKKTVKTKTSPKIKNSSQPKKRVYKKRKNKKRSNPLIFLSIIIFLIASVTFYTIFVFPEVLSDKIKNELISFYNPVIFDDSENMLILKLDNRPSIALQKKVFEGIKERHSLEAKFKKINGNDEKGINKIEFYSNNKLDNDIKPIYIYWDKEIDKEVIELANINIKQKENKYNYEKIEEKRKNEKQEVLERPLPKSFKEVKIKEPDVAVKKAKIAIVIDDVGYSYNSTYDFLTLGFPVTFAIIPDLADSEKFYNLFKNYGYDIILHIPMEPLKGKKFVESNAILSDMSDNEVKNRIDHFLNRYPAAIGANNHMGSKIVKDARIMNIVINELSDNDKFWLDSMTNIETVTKEIASLYKLEYFERDVFLDNNKNEKDIKASVESLIKEAKEKGSAIGIGHIQTKELVTVLKEYYNKKDRLGIEFVGLKDLQ